MADDSESDCDIDVLNTLLQNLDDNELKMDDSKTSNSLQELNYDFLSNETNINDPTSKLKLTSSSPKKAETHSSDEEDIDYFDKREYSGYGEEIKQLLKTNEEKKDESTSKPRLSFSKSNNPSTNIKKKVTTSAPVKTNNQTSKDVYSDPIFGFAINKPLISSAELVDLMQGRKPVPLSSLKDFLKIGKPSEDWVVAGVISYKSPSKKTAKGDNYSIWTLCDLKMDMNTVSLFVFSKAFQTLWKVNEGTIVAVLNPNILDKRGNSDLAPLSVDNPARVMILGTSRDMGVCKSKKKNGEQCNAVVNTRLCDFCIYHVKQEYSKHSKRLDLQSAFSGRGVSEKKKVGNQSSSINKFMQNEQNIRLIPSKKNSALALKDQQTLELLKSNAPVNSVVKDENKPKSSEVDLTENQVKKDFNRLNKLKQLQLSKPEEEVKETQSEISVKTEQSSHVTSTPKTPLSVVAPRTMLRFGNVLQSTSSLAAPQSPLMSRKTSQASIVLEKTSSKASKSPLMVSNVLQKYDLSCLGKIPKLGSNCSNGIIDLSSPIPKRKVDLAKSKALEWIKKNGGIKPSNPNKILESKEAQAKHGVKRKRIMDEEEEAKEKSDRESIKEKFLKLMEAKSSHEDLIAKAEGEKEEKYFNKMEIKEKMEQKMLTTFQVECKAVHCTVCKYIAFSSSEMCKQQGHRVKVFNAVKRFYKCGDCGNRTVTLDRIPTTSCTKCNNTSWVKTAMMDEKRTEVKTAHLSIRGDEEKYFGSTSGANLNLIVPE